MWTWHRSSGHAEVARHMPQLEGPTTKNIQLCTGELWGEKGKIKSLKKKKKLQQTLETEGQRVKNEACFCTWISRLTLKTAGEL